MSKTRIIVCPKCKAEDDNLGGYAKRCWKCNTPLLLTVEDKEDEQKTVAKAK